MGNLPLSVYAYAERTPVEDFALAAIRTRIPDVPCESFIRENQTFPAILVRRSPVFGARDPDPRFIDFASLLVSTFTEGDDADQDGAILADAVRKALQETYKQQTVFPGMGWLSGFDNPTAPRRVTDWATSVGPVQYADLPQGVIRYEAIYNLQLRVPRKTFYNP